jgi:RNA polymerase sigma-70 factor (ECF subfamily)
VSGDEALPATGLPGISRSAEGGRRACEGGGLSSMVSGTKLPESVRPVEAAAACLAEAPAACPAEAPAARLHVLVTENLAFVWRSLIRLGVPRADADDAAQQVFLIAARKLASIAPGSEKSYLFGAAFRIAYRARRTQKRRREVLEAEPHERVDEDSSPEELLDRARARVALDAILDTMPIELRAVFVLFELEQLTIAEIAPMLELPAGTAASRLRRAREHFQAAVRRLEAQRERRGERS